MNNADRLAVFIVDKVADAIKTQFGDKVSFTTLDTVRSVAAVAVKNAVPFPMRLALNAIPASEGNMRLVEESVAKIMAGGVKAIDPETLSNPSNISAMVTNIIKTAASRGISYGSSRRRWSTCHRHDKKSQTGSGFFSPSPWCHRCP